MKLYGGTDLHANNSVVTLIDEQDQVVFQKRLLAWSKTLQPLGVGALNRMDNAIPISARLLHALEKLSAGIPISGPVTNASSTANRKATTERPINTLARFCIALLLLVLS